MIKLVEIDENRKDELAKYMQDYLAELSAYYDIQKDKDGNYLYQYLPLYFVEENRHPYFIYADDLLIGFVLINQYSFTDEKIDNVIGEFTIFPKYRNNNLGIKTIEALKQLRKGTWQIKYSKDNIIATNFWNKVKDKYNGVSKPLNENEVVITYQ